MGTQFAIIYDIVIVAVIGGMVFAGARKGFASVIVGLVTIFVSFLLALVLCGPIASLIYDNIVREPVSEMVSDKIDESLDDNALGALASMDYDKVKISGVYAGEIKPDYHGTSKAVFDLSDLDLSETGIAEIDLSSFGIKKGTDFSSVNAKTADFTMAEIEKHGVGRLAAAQYITICAMDSGFGDSVTKFAEELSDVVPAFFDGVLSGLESGNQSAVRSLIITMSETSSSAKEAVIEKVIEPYYNAIAKTILFILIFGVVSILLGVLANALEIVNKVPVLGKANTAAGAAVGLVEGLVAAFTVCVVAKMIITLCGNEMIFFNEITINSTYIFKYFYNVEVLEFFT